MISLSAYSLQQLVVATLASLPCALAAVGARRVAKEAWRVRPLWLAPLLLLPLAILSDTVQVFLSSLPGIRRAGDFVEVDLVAAAGEHPLARGRRALATWLISATPGSFLVEIDSREGKALLHRLGRRGPRMDKAVGGQA